MFNSGDEKKAILADLMLSDGRELKGKVLIPVTSDLMRVLNGTACFIEFETLAGVKSMIASSAIVEVVETDIPKVRRLKVVDSIDPYETLGLTRDANAKEVKAAYRSLTKQYHPDRYSSMDLPKEMTNYIDEMSRRINSAYAVIDGVFEEEAS